ISEHLQAPLTIEAFTKRVMDHIISSNPDCIPYSFTPEDIKAIEQIKQERYATREWNFGASPDYRFKKDIKTHGGHLEINRDVEKGKIRGVKSHGDFFNTKDISEIETALLGIEHQESAIRKVLDAYPIGDYFHQMTQDDILESMF